MMHKNYSILGLLLVMAWGLNSLQGQSIGDYAVIRIGESAPVRYALGNFDPGPSGTGVTWDFSQLSPDSVAYTWTALDPQSTLFVDSFPAANLSFRYPAPNGVDESWVYYDFDENQGTLDYLGAAQIVSGTTGTDTFYQTLNADPERIHQFPFSYNDSFTDSFSGWNHVSFSGFAVSQSRSGTVTRTVDGSGSLTSPAGSWSNVLRVHSILNITDSYMGQVTTQEIHRYSWYAQGEKYLLLHMDSIILDLGPGGSSTTTQIFYRDGSPITSREPGHEAKLRVWPQPASGQVQIGLPGRGDKLRVRDFHGRILRSVDLTGQSGDFLSLSLDGLRPGLYFLEFQGDSQNLSQKLIIQ